MQVELSIDTESRGKARLRMQNKAFALAWREELPWWTQDGVREVPPPPIRWSGSLRSNGDRFDWN